MLSAIPTEVWFPIVTLVTGILVSSGIDVLRDARLAKREKAARRAALDRKTLMEAQDSVARLARQYQKMAKSDLALFKSVGESGRQPGDDLPVEVRIEEETARKLEARLEDGPIREDLQRLRMIGFELSYYDRVDKTERAIEEISQLEAILNDAIGRRLREL